MLLNVLVICLAGLTSGILGEVFLPQKFLVSGALPEGSDCLGQTAQSTSPLLIYAVAVRAVHGQVSQIAFTSP